MIDGSWLIRSTADRDGGALRNGAFGDPCGAKDLNFMPGHGVDHSSPFSGPHGSAAGPEKSVGLEPRVTRQNFRKGSRQSFRNPHWGFGREWLWAFGSRWDQPPG